MNEEKKWYAVYTRARWEKKVSEHLTRRDIVNYCPLNKVLRQWSDRKKIVHEPLFTSYVFVHISEKQHAFLKQTSGVINLVYWLGKPAVIPEAEINIIKRFLNEHTNVMVERTPVRVNDKVRVLNGPLMEQEGQVLSVRNKTVKIALPSLGYLMYAEVETTNVEVMQKNIINSVQIPVMSYPLYAIK